MWSFPLSFVTVELATFSFKSDKFITFSFESVKLATFSFQTVEFANFFSIQKLYYKNTNWISFSFKGLIEFDKSSFIYNECFCPYRMKEYETEAVVRECSVKKVFSEISQNS